MASTIKVDKIAQSSGTPEFTIPTVDGAANTFLKTDGSGVLSFDSVPSGVTINNNADNRIISGSATANTLEGEANLTYDGTSLGVKNAGTASDIKVYCETANSHYTSIKSAAHAAYTGGSWTMTLPGTDGTASQFLQTDGAGATIWAAAGGDNTPYFSAYINSTYSLASDTTTVMPFDTEYTDSDSAYNTSTYEFTVPAGEGGTYWLGAYMTVEGWTGQLRDASIKIEVNTVAKFQSLFDYQGNYINVASPSCSGNIVLAAGDVVRARTWCYTTRSPATLDVYGDGYAAFSGYKLIG